MTFHMNHQLKCQDLFSLKNKTKKYFKVSSAVIMINALRYLGQMEVSEY